MASKIIIDLRKSNQIELLDFLHELKDIKCYCDQNGKKMFARPKSQNSALQLKKKWYPSVMD